MRVTLMLPMTHLRMLLLLLRPLDAGERIRVVVDREGESRFDLVMVAARAGEFGQYQLESVVTPLDAHSLLGEARVRMVGVDQQRWCLGVAPRTRLLSSPVYVACE